MHTIVGRLNLYPINSYIQSPIYQMFVKRTKQKLKTRKCSTWCVRFICIHVFIMLIKFIMIVFELSLTKALKKNSTPIITSNQNWIIMALDPCQSGSTCFSRSFDRNSIIPANVNQHEHSEHWAALLVSAYLSSFASTKQTSSAPHLFTPATRTAVVIMGLWDLWHKMSCVKRKCLASRRAWHSWGSLLIEFGYFKTGCNDLIKELWPQDGLLGPQGLGFACIWQAAPQPQITSICRTTTKILKYFKNILEVKAFIPDIQPDEVGTRENVIFTEHHPDVRHQDVLQNPEVTEVRTVRPLGCKSRWMHYNEATAHLDAAHDGRRQRRVVLRTQHGGVHQHKSAKQRVVIDFCLKGRGRGRPKSRIWHGGQSAVVYWKQRLTGWISAMVMPKGTRCSTLLAGGHTHITLRPVFLPHDARKDELAEEKHIGPAFIVYCLERRRGRKGVFASWETTRF